VKHVPAGERWPLSPTGRTRCLQFAPERLPRLGVIQQAHGALGASVDGTPDLAHRAFVRLGALQKPAARRQGDKVCQGAVKQAAAASPATHQLRPKTSSRVYLINTRQRSSGGCSSIHGATHPVNSMKLSEAKTIGQSGRLGSEMTKLCWMRSKVVAKSRPARDGGKGGTGASSLRMTCNTHTTARQRSTVVSQRNVKPL